MEYIGELTMICETCRIQRYTFHNRLRGTSVRSDGNRMIVICKAKIKLLDAITDRTYTKPTFRIRYHNSPAPAHT